jgi:hypothetical protein
MPRKVPAYHVDLEFQGSGRSYRLRGPDEEYLILYDSGDNNQTVWRIACTRRCLYAASALRIAMLTIPREDPTVIKSRPFPPAELLLELATRAELMTSPLTTGESAPEYASNFEQAVEALLSSSPPPPVLSDPELAVVARVAARDPGHADGLRANIAALRADLAGHAEKIGDERLNGLLASSAAAATEFDVDAHTLPLPDDDKFAAAINVVSQQTARVTDKLLAGGTRIPIEVIHSSMQYRMLISRPVHFEDAKVEDLVRSYAAPMVHRIAEAEAVTRLAARDIE